MKFKLKDIILVSIISVCFIILLIFIIKKPISVNKFIKICDKYHLSHIDVSKQFDQNKSLISATIGESEDYWQIEFYTFKNSKSAKEKYQMNFDEYKTLEKKSTLSDKKNLLYYSEYSVLTNYRYYHVCRIKNTLLYVNVPIEYKDDVTSIIQKLGY